MMEQVKRVAVGNQTVGGDGKLFVMAGPCVLEETERVLNIGREMKRICESLGVTYIFKASFDKANRSSYTSFRGPGLTEGLRTLKYIKEELGVPVVSDVHSIEQVEPAAEVLDILQRLPLPADGPSGSGSEDGQVRQRKKRPVYGSGRHEKRRRQDHLYGQ